MWAVSPWRHQDWGGSLDQTGLVLLGAALSPSIPHLMLVQDIWEISHFNCNPRMEPWALAGGCTAAMALALTWWPEEQKVSS